MVQQTTANQVGQVGQSKPKSIKTIIEDTKARWAVMPAAEKKAYIEGLSLRFAVFYVWNFQRTSVKGMTMNASKSGASFLETIKKEIEIVSKNEIRTEMAIFRFSEFGVLLSVQITENEKGTKPISSQTIKKHFIQTL